MDQNEKLRLLKSLHLLDQIPESQLVTLGEFLQPRLYHETTVIFEEGSRGNSLFFVSSGQIRITKKVSATCTKDLAVLGAGDCFGEMALIEEVARSATAESVGPAVVFELARVDLNRWLKSRPELAMGFFAELVQVQSQRLRRTSNELTLHFDLSRLLLDRALTPKALLTKVLEHVLPHLEGNWSAATYLYNQFNEEMEFVNSQGEGKFETDPAKLNDPGDGSNSWADNTTYHVSLPETRRPLARIIFRSADPLRKEDRVEIGRMLTTVSRLLASAIENIQFRNEENLRSRLQTARALGAGI